MPFRVLPWDSTHFGFRVGSITLPELDDGALTEVLGKARRQGVQLLYWLTQAQRGVPEVLLREFGGRCVADKVTYHIPLPAESASTSEDVVIQEYPRGGAGERLIELALASGMYSRFAVDPDMPPGTFEVLYTTWIQRSTWREIADLVLVAGPEPTVGMVTLSVVGQIGQIGLIAVDPRLRGRGVGSALVAAAHRAFVACGATQAVVVTQKANHSACKLYERAGYQVQTVQRHYHFWVAKSCAAA